MSIPRSGYRDGATAASSSPIEADVIVVGAGPAGSATATHLARRGLHVALLEKATFPREKVCGDGLTPRATRQLIRLGIDTSDEPAGCTTGACGSTAGDQPFQLDWPELADFPPYGLVRPRADFDDLLARQRGRRGRQAVRAGQRHRTDHRRPDRPDHRRHDQGRPAVSPPRWWSPPTATRPGSAWPWAWPSATTGRWASRSAPTTAARGTTTTTSSPGWSCGTASRGESDLLPGLRLDLRHGRRHLQRRPGHPQHLLGVRQDRLQGRC